MERQSLSLSLSLLWFTHYWLRYKCHAVWFSFGLVKLGSPHKDVWIEGRGCRGLGCSWLGSHGARASVSPPFGPSARLRQRILIQGGLGTVPVVLLDGVQNLGPGRSGRDLWGGGLGQVGGGVPGGALVVKEKRLALQLGGLGRTVPDPKGGPKGGIRANITEVRSLGLGLGLPVGHGGSKPRLPHGDHLVVRPGRSITAAGAAQVVPPQEIVPLDQIQELLLLGALLSLYSVEGREEHQGRAHAPNQNNLPGRPPPLGLGRHGGRGLAL